MRGTGLSFWKIKTPVTWALSGVSHKGLRWRIQFRVRLDYGVIPRFSQENLERTVRPNTLALIDSRK